MTQVPQLTGTIQLDRQDSFTVGWTYAGSSVLPFVVGVIRNGPTSGGWLMDEGPWWMHGLLEVQTGGRSLADTVNALASILARCEQQAMTNDEEFKGFLASMPVEQAKTQDEATS